MASQTFPAASGRVYRPERGGSVGAVPSSTFDAYGSGITLAYDAGAGSYTVNDATNPPAFLPAQQTENTSAFRTFANSNAASAGTYKLTLFNPGAGNTTLALSFVSYGLLESTQQISTTNADIYYRPFIFGLQTPTSGIPTTGTVNYTSVVDGYWVRRRSLVTLTQGYADLRLSGTATFSIDYVTRTVTVSLQLDGTDLLPTSISGSLGTINLGTFTGTSTIATGTSTFSGTLAGNGFSGTFSGALFGSSASEAGLAFRIDDGDANPSSRQHVAGVVVGKGS
ncbi:transferrin-binding protein-like solute binding protein [Novosphingobium sp. G106]|uniref:transferrin-binding protein-like solute binding protein n=1 Tax=Novosphingobium sp. G106 TaxID=2849500 RepID=UPI001C2CDEAC|nr:transferrin-binding protein-like solute binding protein [Novosphingobium sp. G106]MBV1688710.1 transferrin-binding protein-like solute binding protein [Novosphingobium sp. G106]